MSGHAIKVEKTKLLDEVPVCFNISSENTSRYSEVQKSIELRAKIRGED